MNIYTHTLTELEAACGVTLEDVARELPRGMFTDSDQAFIVDSNVGPALAASVARCAFGGKPVKLAGFSRVGSFPVYRPI